MESKGIISHHGALPSCWPLLGLVLAGQGQIDDLESQADPFMAFLLKQFLSCLKGFFKGPYLF